MSVASLRQFREKVNGDQKIQQVMRETGKEADAAWVVSFGKKHGFDFTEGEVREVLGSRELSDFELEMVSGGLSDSRRRPTKE